MSDYLTLDRTATSQHGLLTRTQLHDLDWSDRKIRYCVETHRLRRVSRNVYAAAGSPESWEQLLEAAVLEGGEICAASHRSAARLWGMRSVDDDVDISIPYPRRLALAGVRVHRSRDLVPPDITFVDDIAVTLPWRTLCDLGLVFPLKEVIRIMNHSIATGLVNRRDLWSIRVRNSKQGRNGVGVLGYALETLPDRAEYTESGIEVAFLAICNEFHLPPPAIQLPLVVDGHHFRVDFAFPAHRVFIEIDGLAFHSSADQMASDRYRQNLLVAAGWMPIRLTHHQLTRNPRQVARVLRQALQPPDL